MKNSPAIYHRPEALTETKTHFCAGCGHGIVHKLIGEVVDELGIREKTVGVAPVGCAVLGYFYFNFDVTEAAHGRTPAVATGIKRVLPDRVVFSYQGDGDLAAIGMSETIHAANRGENITVIFVNNSVYGMTGGQMAPTTLVSMRTTTTPFGRDVMLEGHPLKISEMLALLDGVVYIERTAVNSPAGIRKTKKAIRKSFQTQLDGKGFSLVEILSPCPVNWKMGVAESWQWIDKEMTGVFPLGIIKDTTGNKDAD